MLKLEKNKPEKQQNMIHKRSKACLRDHSTVKSCLDWGERLVDFFMKHYGSYRDGEKSQVTLLCKAGKKFQMTYVSAVRHRLFHKISCLSPQKITFP